MTLIAENVQRIRAFWAFRRAGLEYANMFAKLGAKVVVIEFMENILQMLDVDLKVIWLTLRCHQRWLNDALNGEKESPTNVGSTIWEDHP